MTIEAFRWLGAHVWRVTGRADENRRALLDGATGLRIAAFHGTPPATLDLLKRVVETWREDRPVATPAEVDEIVSGNWSAGTTDRLLLTFDDSLATNWDAAVWLARAGIRATFFVIPSLLDRTVLQFARYHADRGVRVMPPVPEGAARGLSRTQVREILAMGHRVAAHNNAHRDLGRLDRARDLHYEIDEAMDAVAELTGTACRDFAVGYGQPENLSAAAAAYLQQRCPNVYMSHRGLNVPGLTPRFLLRHSQMPGQTLAFTRVCLDGGGDHRVADRVREMARRVGLLPAYRGIPLSRRDAPPSDERYGGT